MNIEKDTAVTLRYTVTDALGKVLDDGSAPMVYLHGGYNNIFPKVEAALDGQAVGFRVTLVLQPEDTFGPRDESLVTSISRKEFPPGVKVGGQLQSVGEGGHPQMYTVTKIKGDTVMLDGNHPMAGKVLKFTARVADVRPASAEEIAHRHVHGEHGHHH
ncbi:MAG: peptidylprolyl isomerase [Burkholderiaceae bacterium]|nr:peptidylprolyl isomerase [Burkholderiaceae bacterium]